MAKGFVCFCHFVCIFPLFNRRTTMLLRIQQFRRHTLKDALKGTMAGLAATIVTLLAVGAATHTVDLSLLPKMELVPMEWFLTIVSPVVIGSLVAHLTAQRAVMRELAQLP